MTKKNKVFDIYDRINTLLNYSTKEIINKIIVIEVRIQKNFYLDKMRMERK